ncbi:MAG TPA: sulfatase-like hydrolase/transferase, partial [bacterium]|nr:sulfatase-like hydrolase/transferase [bacterium]
MGQGVLGASILSPLSKCSQKPKKPNVVLILVDDLGWKDLGCYGNKYYETPNIDKFCQDSMKFTDAYASCAVCSPTRAAILTGRYPT